MTLFECLLNEYGYNEPILMREVSFEDYSQPWINKELKKLCDEGRLCRFEKGIYYIPSQTEFGQSLLDPEKVIDVKYIRRGGVILGYYAGLTFLNMIGLSQQVPSTMEICTNECDTRVRTVQIGGRKVILRKARTKVTEENRAVLSLLDCMNYTDASFYSKERMKKIKQYIEQEGIRRKQITEYSPVFPDAAIRTLVESEIIYYAA